MLHQQIEILLDADIRFLDQENLGVEGNIDSIKWTFAKTLLSEIAALLKVFGAKNINPRLPFFRVDKGQKGICGYCIEFDFPPLPVTHEQIVSAFVVALFEDSVFDLIADLPSETGKVVDEFASRFLKTYRGISNKTGSRILLGTDYYDLPAKLRELPNVPNCTKTTYFGVVDSLNFSQNMVGLMSKNRQIKSAFFDHSMFFSDLHNLLGSRELRKFCILENCLEGKHELLLEKIEETGISAGEDLLS